MSIQELEVQYKHSNRYTPFLSLITFALFLHHQLAGNINFTFWELTAPVWGYIALQIGIPVLVGVFKGLFSK